MIDVGTVLWMVGLVLVAGSVGWWAAGAVGAVAGVGLALIVLGAVVDLVAPPRPAVSPRDRAGELI
jgi:hypothetical protein